MSNTPIKEPYGPHPDDVIIAPPKELRERSVSNAENLVLAPPFVATKVQLGQHDDRELHTAHATSFTEDVIRQDQLYSPLPGTEREHEAEIQELQQDLAEEGLLDVPESYRPLAKQLRERAADVAKEFAAQLRVAPPDVNPYEPKLDAEGKLLTKYITAHSPVDTLITSYNHYILHILPKQISARAWRTKDGFTFHIEDLIITPPGTLVKVGDKSVLKRSEEAKVLLPNTCRQQNETYKCNLFVDLVKRDIYGNEVERRKGFYLGSMPLMLNSQFCYRRGKTAKELFEMGESPEDPGGYFIVNGTEYFISGQASLRKNIPRIVEGSGDDPFIASMSCSGAMGASSNVTLVVNGATKAIGVRLHCLVREENGNKKLQQMPLYCIFRMLGIADPQLITSTILQFTSPERRRALSSDLVSSETEYKSVANDVQLFTSLRGIWGVLPEIRDQQAHSMIRNDLFPQMSVKEDGTVIEDSYIDIMKLNLLGLMACRLLETYAGYRKPDDRDDYAQKRSDNGALRIERLVWDLWKMVLDSVQLKLDEDRIIAESGASVDKVVRYIQKEKAFEQIEKCFVSQNWSATSDKDNQKYRTGIVEILKREGVLSNYTQLLKEVTPSTEKSKEVGIRMVAPSQYRYMCPVDTPESIKCGLNKLLGITARHSLKHDDTLIILDLAKYITPTRTPETQSPCLVNGKFLGWINGEQAYHMCRDKRRSKYGGYPRDMSITYDAKDTCPVFTVSTDPCRLVAPLLVVNQATGNLLIDDLNMREASVEDLFNEGCMEYISATEENSMLKVARDIDQLRGRLELIEELRQRVKRFSGEFDPADLNPELAAHAQKSLQLELSRQPFTHCEIDPTAQLGVSASVIPLANHNQAPRNVYQSQMGKQALGVIASNEASLFAATGKMLSFPTRPAFEPQMNAMLGMDKNPAGQTVRVAITPYMGTTMEDGFVFNADSLKRGLFTIVKFRIEKLVTGRNAKKTDPEIILHPMNPMLKRYASDESRSLQRRYAQNPSRYQYLDEDGFVRVGSVVKQYDCLVSMVRISTEGGVRREIDMSMYVPLHEGGEVTEVLKTTGPKENIIVYVKFKSWRIPEPGDKFAPRNAQKGTITQVLPASKMPYTRDGPVDIIINPHCMPSRMTVSMFFEMVASKAAILTGQTFNATSFREQDMDAINRILMDYGYDANGKETLYSGITGEPIAGKVFVGPIFYQALKHNVIDKIQATRVANRDPVYRQPISGRKVGGAVRVGLMEKDTFISHGLVKTIEEMMCTMSDAKEVVFCKHCGHIAIDNPAMQNIECRFCERQNQFARVTVPTSFLVLVHYLAGAGMSLRVRLGKKGEKAKLPPKKRDTNILKKMLQREQRNHGLPDITTEHDEEDVVDDLDIDDDEEDDEDFDEGFEFDEDYGGDDGDYGGGEGGYDGD